MNPLYWALYTYTYLSYILIIDRIWFVLRLVSIKSNYSLCLNINYKYHCIIKLDFVPMGALLFKSFRDGLDRSDLIGGTSFLKSILKCLRYYGLSCVLRKLGFY